MIESIIPQIRPTCTGWTSHAEQAKALLAHLWRGGQFAYWWTPDTGRYYSDQDGTQRECKDSLWFPADRPAQIPHAWRTRNVYFGVNPCGAIPTAVNRKTGKQIPPHALRSRIADVCAINTLFAEYDVKDMGSMDAIEAHLDGLPYYPTVTVRSGGGVHAYWLLSEPELVTDDNRGEYRLVQAAWVELVGADGASKDLARVLRVPGYQNRKPHYAPNYPTVRILEFARNRFYDFERLAALVRQRAEAMRAHEQAPRHEEYRAAPGAVFNLQLLLQHINPRRADDYAEWLRVGMAIKQEAGNSGFELWDDWSRHSAKYDRAECEKKWRNFQPDGRATVKTLAHLAREDGMQ